MSKLAIIIPVLNQFPLAQTAIDFAAENLSGDNEVEFVILDNASDTKFSPYGRDELDIVTRADLVSISVSENNGEVTSQLTNKKKAHVKVIHLEKNIGVYPIFWEALKHTDADILAFFHSDLIVSEKNWDTRLLNTMNDLTIGLVGFIGSNEIDSSGGRGSGTTSNFQGGEYLNSNEEGIKTGWKGSPAYVHGMANQGYTKAAVVDGCAMVFRRLVLELIKQRENFPPHHFYDRLLSCQVREIGYNVGVLGIACDHISGQTVNQENAYSVMAQEWAIKHGLDINGVHNWDSVLYREAERQWLNEYRATKHLVPVHV